MNILLVSNRRINNAEAVAPVIAVITLTLVAVSASLMVYTWVTTHPLPEETTSQKLMINLKIVEAAYSPYEEKLRLFVLNAGGIDTCVDSLYIYDMRGELLSAYEIPENQGVIEAGELRELELSNVELELSKNYILKVVTPQGAVTTTFSTLTALPPPKKVHHAVIAYYCSIDYRCPRFNEFNGSHWIGEVKLPNSGGTVYCVRVATCPISTRAHEVIVVTASSDRRLDIYVWNGTNWAQYPVPYDIYIGYRYRAFDIAYESKSGRAILVYWKYNPSWSYTTDYELRYRIWDGSKWSTDYPLDLIPGKTRPRYTRIFFISLASNPKSNEVALICYARYRTWWYNYGVFAAIWDGSSWSVKKLSRYRVSAYGKECVAVAYESLSGEALFVWGQYYPYTYRNWIYSCTYSSTEGWSTPGPRRNIGGTPQWITLKPNPASNEIMLTCIDNRYDLNTMLWDGDSWSPPAEHDSYIEGYGYRCADFDWEPDGKGGLLVWGDRNVDALTYRVWGGSSWGPIKRYPGLTTDQQWVQVKRNYAIENVTIMIATIDDGRDLVVTAWNGSAMTMQEELTSYSDYRYCERFELEFKHFGEYPQH